MALSTRAVVNLALRSVESLQSWISILDRAGKSKELRGILEWLEALPMLENDLAIVANRLRDLLKSYGPPPG